MSNLVSQKCFYGIKAVFELARTNSDEPVKIHQIADKQNIPIRFLEAILRQLRQGGFVDSRRGAEGGYLLARRPTHIKVGDIISFFEGEVGAFVPGENGSSRERGASDLVLDELWTQSRTALAAVFDAWTIQDLVDKADYLKSRYTMNFSI